MKVMDKIKKPQLEEVHERGEIRLEVYRVRSSITPQWWEFGKRMRWWQLQQRVRTNRKKLSVESQIALTLAEEALEREFRGRT